MNDQEAVDEQRRVMAEYHRDPNAVITELLALRAERATPTQGDEERAHRLLVLFSRLSEDEDFETPLLAAFASIRAEGSAELEAARATLDDEIASHQDTLRLWNELHAERAKLEAALQELRPRYGAAHQMLCDHFGEHPATIDERVRERVAARTALAQPAESGATEVGPFESVPEHDWDPGFGPVPPKPKVVNIRPSHADLTANDPPGAKP